MMIYCPVERGRVCIDSQLEICSASEVAAMIEVLLRQLTSMIIDRECGASYLAMVNAGRGRSAEGSGAGVGKDDRRLYTCPQCNGSQVPMASRGRGRGSR